MFCGSNVIKKQFGNVYVLPLVEVEEERVTLLDKGIQWLKEQYSHTCSCCGEELFFIDENDKGDILFCESCSSYYHKSKRHKTIIPMDFYRNSLAVSIEQDCIYSSFEIYAPQWIQDLVCIFDN